MRGFALFFFLLISTVHADDSIPYYDWAQDALHRIVPAQMPLEFLGVSPTACRTEPFSMVVLKSSTSAFARNAIRGMYLYGTDCWTEALKTKKSSQGVYSCKNRKKVPARAQTDAQYARFMSVHFNAAAECLGVKNYRKLLFGEMLKESSLQNRIESGGSAPARGPFQMTSVAFEDLVEKRNDIGATAAQQAMTARLNRVTQGPTLFDQPACQVFLSTDRALIGAKKDPEKLVKRMKNACDSLNGGEDTAESQAAPLYLGMLYNAYQIALVEEKIESLGVDKKLGWKLKTEIDENAEFCDRYVSEHRAACVTVVESVVAIGHNVGGPSATAALEAAMKSKSSSSSKRSVAQASARFATDITSKTALGKGLAHRSDTRKLVALTYYDNPSLESQRALEKKVFGSESQGPYRPGILQELEQIEKAAGAQCF